jgi:hypothetical protein
MGALVLVPLGCSFMTSLDGLAGGQDDGGRRPVGGGDDGGATPEVDAAKDTGAPATDTGAPKGDAGADAHDAGGASIDAGPEACSPTPLACDGKVHACDGVVDEGCPDTVSVGAPGSTTTLGGTPTDFTPFSDTCPAGQVLVGIGGATGQWIDAAWGVCGALSVNATSNAVTIGPGATLPTRGTVGSDVTWLAQCPANEAVVGIAGNSGRGMDSFVLTCAPLVVSGPVGSLTLHQGGGTTLASVGDVGGGGPFTPFVCNDPDVVTLVAGSAGQWLASYGAACATPSLTMK